MVNWQEIHPDFTPELQETWKTLDFNYEETKEWIKIGLTPREARVADFAREKGHDTKWCLENYDVKELREEYAKNLTEDYSTEEENSENDNEGSEKRTTFEDWKKIHPDFKENYWAKTSWEQLGFNYKQTRWWIKKVGLEPKDWDLAYYLREEIKKRGPSERLVDEYDEWKENVDAQKYLNYFYPLEKRNEITKLSFATRGLKGELIVENFPNLEEIECSLNPELRSVTIRNLPKLNYFSCGGLNEVSEFSITNCPEISYLVIDNNLIASLDFLNGLSPEKLIRLAIEGNIFSPHDLTPFNRFINLEDLSLGGGYIQNRDNHFYGSLKPLRKLKKLKFIDIHGTNVDSGLEYLPDSLEKIGCNFGDGGKYRGYLKIREELKDYFLEGNDYDYQTWKENQPALKLLKEKLGKINPILRVRELLGSQDIFFNVKTGDFEGNLQGLISLLQINKILFEPQEQEIQDLIKKIKQQGKKIIEAYLHFAPEKDLLRKLLINYWELTKTKKQELPSVKLQKEYNDSWVDLESKIEGSLMEKVQLILNNCEKFVDLELELETKFNSKRFLLEEQRKFPLITFTNFASQFNQSKPTLEYPPIGKGGYGEVYRGKWKFQNVAVKKLHLLPASISEEETKKITNEIDILQKLRNRYIIQYYGFYSDNQQFLIIMDYAENGTLTKFINNNKDKEHDWNFNTKIIEQMAKGLAYIHQEGFLHRDLKSMNILLTNNYEAKIADFGLAKTKNISSSRSNHFEIVGSLGWMAPEVLKDQKYSEQSDIYSLGMIIWEIADKCTVPYKKITDYALLRLHVVEDNKREKMPNDTPQNICNIIEGCWKADLGERINLTSILKLVGSDELHLQNASDRQNLLQQNPMEANEENTLGIDLILNEQETDSKNNELIIFSSPIGLTTTIKRKLSLSAEEKCKIKETKLESEELMEIDNFVITENLSQSNLSTEKNWRNIYPSFTPELAQQWQSHNFTYQQTQEWIRAGFQPTDADFCAWLRDIKSQDLENFAEPQWIKEKVATGELSINELREAYQQEYQAQIQIPPK